MVEIIYYEKVEKNKTIAHVDVKVPILTPTTIVIRNIAQLKTGDRKWLAFPSFKRDEIFHKYFQFENEEYNKVLIKKIDEELKKYLMGFVD